jgi:uncharacterized protein
LIGQGVYVAEFLLLTQKTTTNERMAFVYDNMTSKLRFTTGEPVIVHRNQPRYEDDDENILVNAVSKDTPGRKSYDLDVFKIQLGLTCNFACTYCSQRFIPNAPPTTSPKHVERFLEKLPDINPRKIEFWGGEPFVYWPTFKPLAEALRKRFPTQVFVVISNGSLLDYEKNAWLEALKFNVAISHDGPGQHVRGDDPLDDPQQRAVLKDLFTRLAPHNRISFNVMMHKGNQSRAAVEQWFREKLSDFPLNGFGEGGFVDPYDEGGVSSSLTSDEDTFNYRRQSVKEIRNNMAPMFYINQRINEWLDTFAFGRDATKLGQKCGMDNPKTVAVDLQGNVLTCQNVSHVSKAPNGQSHKIGRLEDLENVKLDTATHWSKRKDCSTCPVLQSCKGSCMFLEDELWELGCNNAFSDHIGYFAVAVEMATGYLPYAILGGRPDRVDLFKWKDVPDFTV